MNRGNAQAHCPPAPRTRAPLPHDLVAAPRPRLLSPLASARTAAPPPAALWYPLRSPCAREATPGPRQRRRPTDRGRKRRSRQIGRPSCVADQVGQSGSASRFAASPRPVRSQLSHPLWLRPGSGPSSWQERTDYLLRSIDQNTPFLRIALQQHRNELPRLIESNVRRERRDIGVGLD